MSTSYSSRARTKLFRLLNTLLRLSEMRSKSHRSETRRPSSLSHTHSPISTSNFERPTDAFAANIRPIQFESMCSMCFIDDNKLKTCSRCQNRMLSKCSMLLDNKCSMCVDKLYVDIKIGGSSCRMKEARPYWFSSISFRLNDFHLANLCLLIFFASLVFLYQNQPLYE